METGVNDGKETEVRVSKRKTDGLDAQSPWATYMGALAPVVHVWCAGPDWMRYFRNARRSPRFIEWVTGGFGSKGWYKSITGLNMQAIAGLCQNPLEIIFLVRLPKCTITNELGDSIITRCPCLTLCTHTLFTRITVSTRCWNNQYMVVKTSPWSGRERVTDGLKHVLGAHAGAASKLWTASAYHLPHHN